MWPSLQSLLGPQGEVNSNSPHYCRVGGPKAVQRSTPTLQGHTPTRRVLAFSGDSSDGKPGDGASGGSLRSYTSTMLGSATSGALARLPCHPIDTCKARLQVQSRVASDMVPYVYRNFAHAAADIWKKEGLAGLYRGIGITVLGSAPAACLYFTAYEMSRDKLMQSSMLSGFPFAAHFAAGMIAESISCLLWVPIDVVKERMQIQQVLRSAGSVPTASSTAASVSGSATAALEPAAPTRIVYRSSWHALSHIQRHEGITSLYRGYGATLASFGPFSAFYFLFYEKLKTGFRLAGDVPEGQALPFLYFLSSGALAGAMASFITNPLDMAKLRLQVQRGAKAAAAASGQVAVAPKFEYRGFIHAIRSIAAEEGIKGLWRGAGARMAFHAPMTAISISLFEECKLMYDALLGGE